MTVLKVFFVFIAMIATAFCEDDGTTPDLPTTVLTVSDGTHTATVTAELATTSETRETGLMRRYYLPEDEGMLFVFPGERNRVGFWMRNTYIRLDIAYLGPDGTVQEIRHGVPLSTALLTPDDPYAYVLEVNYGWFERHNLGVGAVVQIPDGLPAGT